MQMATENHIVLGVDGGATKTACTALLLATRQNLSQAYAGPSNWYLPCSTCMPALLCASGPENGPENVIPGQMMELRYLFKFVVTPAGPV